MKVRQLGAGTRKSVERHRRAIREVTLEASDAEPCWTLPEWRVAEQLSSELATFDLVIIDEASQFDITSLPTVLRGKKLLVVGDDKQVSPSAVGMNASLLAEMLFQVPGVSFGLPVERRGLLNCRARRDGVTWVDLAALALHARGLCGFGFANGCRCYGDILLQLRNLRLQLRDTRRGRFGRLVGLTALGTERRGKLLQLLDLRP
jgi:hypothetical protein